MAKKITLNYEGTVFELEFNRSAIKTLEGNGFVVDQIGEKPMTMIPELFYGAFYMHHRGIKRSLVDEMYDYIPDKEGLLINLLDMYRETIQTLTSDADEEKSKNVTWTMS